MNKKHLWVVLAIVLTLAAFFLFTPKKTAGISSGGEISSTGEAAIGGPFTLVNQDGDTVTDETYAGKLKLVFFGFTFCPDICPTDLLLMSNVMKQLSETEAAQLVPIFISVDPERDTPSTLKAYLSNFHPSIQGLTGTQGQVDTAVKAYRVYAKKVQPEGAAEYLMDHSAYLYLMGRDGKYLTHFQHNEKPEVVVEAIRNRL